MDKLIIYSAEKIIFIHRLYYLIMKFDNRFQDYPLSIIKLSITADEHYQNTPGTGTRL